MLYKPGIENFQDNVNFSQDSNCTWIVYPPGAAGDLVVSILNFHYARTGGRFFGITDTGQVIFRDSNKKDFNSNFKVDQNFINITNQKLGEENLNLSLLDNVIFSNHGYQNKTVDQILNFFPNAKVIRILPQDNIEYSIVKWLALYKHTKNAVEFLTHKDFTPLAEFEHDRVLELKFGDLFNEARFEKLYTSIVEYLGLEYKLIRFDFIKFWFSRQHPIIQPALTQLSS